MSDRSKGRAHFDWEMKQPMHPIKHAPDPGWGPVSREELDVLIASELGGFDDTLLSVWGRYGVPVRAAPINRSAEWGLEKIFVVAQSGAHVVVYDNDEDQWALGRLDARDKVAVQSLCGDLRSALSRLAKTDTP